MSASRFAVLAVLLAWLVLAWPWLAGDAVVPWDSKDQFYPTLRFVADSIRSGESPFWNPFVYGGGPTVSDPQSMMFSPLALMLMLLRETPSPGWFDGVELLHLLMGGMGLLFYCRRRGLSAVAGASAALVYMFGGAAAARMQHVPMIFAYGYFPLALVALDAALETGRLRHGVLFGLAAGVMAAHQNQVAFLLSLVLVGYAFWQLVFSGRSVPWPALAAGAATGALVLAVPLYATFQFLPLTNRIDLPLEAAGENALHPLSWLTLLIRDFFSHEDPSLYWGFGDLTETYLYAGALPVVLLLLAGGVLREGNVRFFVFAGFLAGLYGLGSLTPFYSLVWELVPGVSLYRRPADAGFVLNAVLAILTAHLIDGLRSGAARLPGGRGTLLASAALLALVFPALVEALRQDRSALLPAAAVPALLWAGGALALVFWLTRLRSPRLRGRLVWLAFFFLAIDLGVHNVNQSFNAADGASLALFDASADPGQPLRFLRDELGTDASGAPYRAEIVLAGSLWANAPMVLGIHSTQGYNPLRYRLYEDAVGAQEMHSSPRPFPPMLPGYGGRMLDLLGVRFVVSGRPLAELDPGGLDFLIPRLETEGVRIWENPDPAPRVVLATEVLVEPDMDGAIREGRLAEVDYRTTVVLDHRPEGLSSGPPLLAGARVVSYTNDTVRVEVDAARDAILVLHDLYYPRWEVRVDGAPREMLRSNYLFRGVFVEAGRHEVTFRFRPFRLSAVGETLARVFDSNRPGPSNRFPTVTRLEPSRGSGRRRTFVFGFRDPDGYADLARQTILFNDTLSVSDGCYLFHEGGRVQLTGDTGVDWRGPVTLGDEGVLENSQCRIDAAGSSVSGSGEELTLSLDLSFLDGFEGVHAVWAYTEDTAHRSDFARVGFWALWSDPSALDRLRLFLGIPGR